MGRRKPRRTKRSHEAPVLYADSGSIVAGRDVKNSNSFHTHTTVLPAGALKRAPKLEAPTGLSNVPQPHGFVGRDSQLAMLDAAFATSGEVIVQALHGLGGVGKSTLAACWATKRSRSSPQWWITADSRTSLDSGLADLAVALQPAFRSAETGADELREWALLWLATHRNWLIVLDNVNDPQHIRPVIDRAGRGGRFLITSRRATGWHQLSSAIALDVLEAPESIELFTRILNHGKTRTSEGAAEVCAEVGCLPLAVEQAASYCAETGVSPRSYLELLKNRPAEMFAATTENGEADRTIARIWSITLDHLRDTPLAGEVLRVLAWYAPDGIPRSLLDDLRYPPALRAKMTRLRSQCGKHDAKSWRGRIHQFRHLYAEQMVDPLALNNAIGRLAAYSMIGERDGNIAVHRLVQTLARTSDPKDPHRQAGDIADAHRTASSSLAHQIPKLTSDPSTWQASRPLLPHLIVHAELSQGELEGTITASLLTYASAFLYQTGSINRSIAIGCRALEINERMLGTRHSDTLVGRSNLATAYWAAGDFKTAIRLNETNVAESATILGADHPQALKFRFNLAATYRYVGDFKKAIPSLQSTLADLERILGADHPDTLICRHGLACAYQAMGDLQRAIPLLQSTLADLERALGADHPDAIISRGNLAGAYQDAGDHKKAVSLFRSTLADCERVLGAEHPHTLTSQKNLKNAYQAAKTRKRPDESRSGKDCREK
ncbi:FxSxx-COOH system tetratricopeptide repeat protein [Streptomyces sp. E11-3]|uniref:FxSxx-COOH system tetratricopeptide repeat protein n=1 Tax=Streptomyces sp. E11-3 TaxID=3110112 RepID=UPI00398187BD